MILSALTWPTALVAATAIAALGLVLGIATWSIFRIGQTAVARGDGEDRDLVERLRADVEELRAQLGR
jgi:hypothetical protein